LATLLKVQKNKKIISSNNLLKTIILTGLLVICSTKVGTNEELECQSTISSKKVSLKQFF
jgi:hypothetical protein